MQRKLQGIEMALAQTHKSKGPETKCPNKTRIGIIFTDNQAAIQAYAALEDHLVSISYTRFPSWRLNYGDTGGTYNCSGSCCDEIVVKIRVLFVVLFIVRPELEFRRF